MRLRDRVLAVFPPPSLLAAEAAGVAVSDGNVRCAVLRDTSRGARLAAYADTPLPEGVIVDGDVETLGRLVEVLRSVRLRHGIRSASACLPERKAYLYQAVVPGAAQELRAAVQFDLETHVPLPPREIAFDFEPVRVIEAGTVVSVTAYARRIVESYTRAFAEAGITLSALESEPQSVARAVLPASARADAAMIVDVGRRSTRVIIAEYGVVAFTAAVAVGGDAFTAALAKFFRVPLPEAEKLKSERGFVINSKNADAVEALITAVSVIRDEVLRHLSYWNGLSDDALPRRRVREIILAGESADLAGLPEYLEGATGLPVSVANVWGNVCSLDAYIPPLPFGESLAYAAPLGLAVRGLPGNLW